MEGYEHSKHQAAGHDGCMTSEKDGGIFIKKTTAQEVEFYSQTVSKDSDEERLEGSSLVDWMPVFLGTLQEGRGTDGGIDNGVGITRMAGDDADAAVEGVKSEGTGCLKSGETDQQYIVLENLYRGYKFPSILDVKLGSQLTDDTVTAEKAERLRKVSETTTSGSLGFRVCGMKTYCGPGTSLPKNVYSGMNQHYTVDTDDDGSRYLSYSKYFGRSLDEKTVAEGLLRYFDCYHKDKFILKSLITTFKNRLSLLYNCLLDEEVRIFSGSLLFIYESDDKKWADILNDEEAYSKADPLVREHIIEDSDSESDEEDGEKQGSKKGSSNVPLSSLNMIDFAHAKHTKGEGYDENVIAGIENLIQILEDIYNTIDEAQ